MTDVAVPCGGCRGGRGAGGPASAAPGSRTSPLSGGHRSDGFAAEDPASDDARRQATGCSTGVLGCRCASASRASHSADVAASRSVSSPPSYSLRRIIEAACARLLFWRFNRKRMPKYSRRNALYHLPNGRVHAIGSLGIVRRRMNRQMRHNRWLYQNCVYWQNWHDPCECTAGTDLMRLERVLAGVFSFGWAACYPYATHSSQRRKASDKSFNLFPKSIRPLQSQACFLPQPSLSLRSYQVKFCKSMACRIGHRS